MTSSRSDLPNLGYLPSILQPRSGSPTANGSPTEPTGGPSIRSSFAFGPGTNPPGKMAGTTRSGAGSPSHDLANASRPFSKRAREIQAQEGLPLSVWGPPTSGNSTPLRENIPESPTDGFPEFATLPTSDGGSQTRRARAGTVPSRFSPGAPMNGLGALPSLVSKSTRVTPSPSPYKSPSPNLGEIGDNAIAANNAILLSRLRAGSMPQRVNFTQTPSPFGVGPSVFSTNWPAGRERTSTLASIASLGSNGPSSPAQSSFSREGNGENDMQMRTLDYLGLADTPQPSHASLVNAHPFLANMVDLNKSANRFRSYSVNAKEKYAEEEDDEYDSGRMTPYEAHQARLQYELAQTNAAIQQHNLAVQAFANQASTNRPRARTAGVLEAPGSRLLRNYYPSPSHLDNSISATDLRLSESHDYDGLPEAVQALRLGQNRNDVHLSTDENSLEGPTSALWLGSIPSSTTVSTLTEMFKSHGPIISARVLTHKNCGFVNFERLESAVTAKQMLNGKEVFPGAGPVRINFAKPPSSNGTPGHDGIYSSPSPDPFTQAQDKGVNPESSTLQDSNGAPAPGGASRAGNSSMSVPQLADMRGDIVEIVKNFGATEEDQIRISHTLQKAAQYDQYQPEIPAVQEPSQNRVHDAPKLREIRKRIDNNSLTPAEIENIALDMLPEVAELSSDYLGNTVVQKLFDFSSDSVRDAMLAEIAPHMAEIGVHKNGTWAAQKIIDVAKMPEQIKQIVDNLRPYTVPLFLDQFGNYVLQCCLRFGSPYNDFIFEAMLSKMWDIAQGRYGARAMRACLESHHATRDQQRMLAAAIAINSVQLATNANGALLLTWFLDTCTFPQRRTVLAPRLVPHLVHLCTHKVAYLTVLKVINQRNELEARDTILKALFFSPDNKTLEDILSDHACGATLIFKVLTTPFFDENIRSQVVENVRDMLIRLKAQPGQGYKRLMDEVGMSTRNATAGPSRDHGHSSHSHERQRPVTQQQQNQVVPPPQPQFGGQFYPPTSQAAFEMQRTESVDSNMSPYTPQYGIQPPMFASASVPITPLNPLQYQPGMIGRAAAPLNNFHPHMNGNFGGYSSPSPAMDQYRNQAMPNGSPIQPSPMAPAPVMNQNGFVPPAYGMGYGYGGMGMQNLGYLQQQEQVNGRRGRVSYR